MNKMSKRKVGQQFTEPVLRLTERWDVRMLENIKETAHFSLDWSNRIMLNKIVNAITSDGRLSVDYKLSEAHRSFGIDGRMYATYGAQGVKGWVRRLCCHKYYHDIDIVNCYPVLLLQIAEKHHVEASALRGYVLNREAVLKDDMREYDLTRDEAKQAYLAVMFNGRVRYESAFLKDFKADVSRIITALWNMSEYRLEKTCVKSKKDSNVKGSFLSTVINVIERIVVEAAMEYFTSRGFSVESYMFDGFMIAKDDPKLAQFDFNALSKRVEEKTGYKVDFVEKPLCPTDEDYNNLWPALNNFRVNNRATSSDVFRNIESLAERLNKTPRENSVSAFCTGLLEEMNKAFALIRGKIATVVERVDFDQDGLVGYERRRLRDALECFCDQVYTIKYIHKNDEVKTADVNIFEIWKKSKSKIIFSKIVLNPRPYSMPDSVKSTEFNYFVGYAYAPRQMYTRELMQELENGVLKPFCWHIKHIWCSGDEECYSFVMKWFAATVQCPWRKLQSALVLKSKPGGGKGIIINLLADLMGRRYVSRPGSLEEITGNGFNSNYFKQCLLMFLDEVFYAGNKKTKNSLKTKITDDEIVVHEKFLESYVIPNLMNLIIASNEQHVINVDIGQRRYMTLDLDNVYAGNHDAGSDAKAHFEALASTDLQVLSNYLHSIDVTDFKGDNPPTTAASAEQVVLSFNSQQKFLHDILYNPEIIDSARIPYHLRANKDDVDPLAGEYIRSAIYEIYKKDYRGYHCSERELWRLFRGTIDQVELPQRQPRVCGGRVRLVQFPQLEQARNSFKDVLNLQKYSFNQ